MEESRLSQSELISFLHESVRHYDDKARASLERVQATGSLAIALVGVLAPILFSDQKYAVGLFISPAASALLVLAAVSTGEMFALSAYRDDQDATLSRLLLDSQRRNSIPVVYVPWSQSGGSVQRRSHAYVTIQLVGFIAVGASIPAFSIFLWNSVPTLRSATIVSTFAGTALFVGSLLSYRDSLTMYARTSRAIRDAVELATGASPTFAPNSIRRNRRGR